MHGHGLQILGPHNRAEKPPVALPSWSVMITALRARVFPGRAGADETDFRAVFIFQQLLDFVGSFSPEVCRAFKFGLAVVDPQITRFVCPT